jgi:hypothetical protein
MSIAHFLYLGHFVHERRFVQFARTEDNGPWIPVVARPMETSVIEQILGKERCQLHEPSLFPVSWPMSLKDGFIVCNRFELSWEAIRFLACLVRTTEYDIRDINSCVFVKVENLARFCMRRGSEGGEKSAMFQWDEPESTDGVRHRPLAAS